MKRYSHSPIHFFTSLLLIIFMYVHSEVFCQNAPANKLSLGLYKLLQENTYEQMPVLIKGDVASVERFIISHNGTVKSVAGNIISAKMPVDAIKKLNTENYVQFIDCPVSKMIPLNDVMIIQNNVDSAYMGSWPLSQGYDGTGVVIGIIDLPIDYTHGDFKDAGGNNRIKYIWDQTLGDDGTAPAPFNYGIECDSASIANGTCPSNDFDEQHYSHGSGVAGIAASSGLAANRFRGVAPNADIVFVSFNFEDDVNFSTLFTDAVDYIFEKADELNEPCVINTSLGDYRGSHDGKDMVAQYIDNKLSEKNGRALVAAAGNAGNQNFHLGYSVNATPQFTWFKKLSYYNAVYYQLWADTADFNHVNFSFAADDAATFALKGQTPDYNMLTDYSLIEGSIDSSYYTITDGTDTVGSVETYVQLNNGTYLMEVFIIPTNPTDYWRFTTSGTGTFDVWASEGFTGFSNYVQTGLPSAAIAPDIVNYKLPDNAKTTVSSWQCSDKVITVGSYVNRDTMTNYYHLVPSILDIPGALFISSSHGPTRDNRIKPDICATGARVISTGSAVLTNWLISLGAANYMSIDGQHYMQNGTSFASPVVAGVAALYFQQNPNADYAEVKNAITSQGKHDAFTGEDLPDNLWGYGKVNAFRTLTGPWGCSAEDYTNPPQNISLSDISANTAGLQWDLIPNASAYKILYKKVSGGSYVKKSAPLNHKLISGLEPNTTYVCKIRALCTTYGASNWTAPFLFTTLPMKIGDAYPTTDIRLYPNPASTLLFIDGYTTQATATLYTMQGERIQTIILTEDKNSIDISNLQNGVYILSLQNETMQTNKQFVVIK